VSLSAGERGYAVNSCLMAPILAVVGGEEAPDASWRCYQTTKEIVSRRTLSAVRSLAPRLRGVSTTIRSAGSPRRRQQELPRERCS
jgi:hypothetical protein